MGLQPIKRRRKARRVLAGPRERVDLASVARSARYVGSVEHKTGPSPAGWPRPRADASICSSDATGDFARLDVWLKAAIEDGQIGEPWEGDFPRYVWHRHEDTVYEARLVNRAAGEYKGYPLEREEWPEGLDED